MTEVQKDIKVWLDQEAGKRIREQAEHADNVHVNDAWNDSNDDFAKQIAAMKTARLADN